MLTKRLDGLWTDKIGFIAAIVTKWNTKINGTNSYVFIAHAMDTVPYTITSNGIDDSVLLSQEMYNILLAKGIARPITDAEAYEANKNAEIEQTNEVLAQNEIHTRMALASEAAKPAATANSSQKPKPVKVAPIVPPTPNQAHLIASGMESDAIDEKKGK